MISAEALRAGMMWINAAQYIFVFNNLGRARTVH